MNKKSVLVISICAVVVVVLIILLNLFTPKNLTSIEKDLKGLKASEIVQIELERSPCCGPQEDRTLNQVIVDTNDVNKIISVLQETKVKRDYKFYNGGSNYLIKITTKNGNEIDVQFNQTKILGTKYIVQGNKLWDLLNSLIS